MIESNPIHYFPGSRETLKNATQLGGIPLDMNGRFKRAE